VLHDRECIPEVRGDGRFRTGDAAVVHPHAYAEIRDMSRQ